MRMAAKKESKSSKKEPKHVSRDEFDLEEIAYALTEAKEEGKYKVFAVHKRAESITGIVTKMDANTKLIHIKDNYTNIHKIHFLDILSVSNTEQ